MNPTLLDDPLVQAGVAPFLVALATAWGLARWRLSGLAVAAAVATAVALSAGIGFTPLSASRKIVLLVLCAPVAGALLDRLAVPGRIVVPVLATLSGLAAPWVFQTVLVQQASAQAWLLGAGVAVFVAGLVGATLALRDDGVAAGAATLGLGLAAGVAAVLSASIGNLINGIALSMAGAALLLVQLLRGRPLAVGFAGAWTAGLAAAFFAAATFVLAELRWPSLVALLLIPLAARLPLLAGSGFRTRVVALGVTAVLAALPAIAAAWLAARVSAP